jgi:hypothetical protein
MRSSYSLSLIAAKEFQRLDLFNSTCIQKELHIAFVAAGDSALKERETYIYTSDGKRTLSYIRLSAAPGFNALHAWIAAVYQSLTHKEACNNIAHSGSHFGAPQSKTSLINAHVLLSRAHNIYKTSTVECSLSS